MLSVREYSFSSDTGNLTVSPVAGPLHSYLGETTAFSECLAALQLNRRRYWIVLAPCMP